MVRQVSHNPGLFYIILDNEEKAYLRYTIEGNIMVIESTYTPEKYRSLGLAEKITKEAVEYAKEKKLKVKPVCSYAVRFFQKHTGYKELKLAL